VLSVTSISRSIGPGALSNETHRFTVVPELLSLTDKELLVSVTFTPVQNRAIILSVITHFIIQLYMYWIVMCTTVTIIFSEEKIYLQSHYEFKCNATIMKLAYIPHKCCILHCPSNLKLMMHYIYMVV